MIAQPARYAAAAVALRPAERETGLTLRWKMAMEAKGCLAVWLFGLCCLAVWLFGCLAVWLFGCLAVWLFGFGPNPAQRAARS